LLFILATSLVAFATNSQIRFREVLPDDTFYSAAVGLDDEGYRTVDDVAAKLIEASWAIWTARLNAPSSSNSTARSTG
jgi:hypothetical protein